MECKRCLTVVLSDDARTCPVCGTDLYSPDNPGKPEVYDPSEDADVLPQAYMTAPAPPANAVDDKVFQGLHVINRQPAVAGKEKKKRRHINHREGWVDPRKRKKDMQAAQ